MSDLEQLCLDVIWSRGKATAEEVRVTLVDRHPMKESTVRTILRRLEQKGYVNHELRGRTFVYRTAEPRHNIVARAIRSVVDRLCGGSMEALLVGMVENDLVSEKDLSELGRMLAERRRAKRGD